MCGNNPTEDTVICYLCEPPVADSAPRGSESDISNEKRIDVPKEKKQAEKKVRAGDGKKLQKRPVGDEEPPPLLRPSECSLFGAIAVGALSYCREARRAVVGRNLVLLPPRPDEKNGVMERLLPSEQVRDRMNDSNPIPRKEREPSEEEIKNDSDNVDEESDDFGADDSEIFTFLMTMTRRTTRGSMQPPDRRMFRNVLRFMPPSTFSTA